MPLSFVSYSWVHTNKDPRWDWKGQIDNNRLPKAVVLPGAFYGGLKVAPSPNRPTLSPVRFRVCGCEKYIHLSCDK